jgi:glycerol kinase
VLGVPIVKPAQTEATAWGVAALAGIKSGIISGFDDVAAKRADDVLIAPMFDRRLDYQGWQRALKAVFATVQENQTEPSLI